jgi:hypothetical protein
MLATILAGIGIILVIAGLGIVTIHNTLRGSGLGTISIVLGIIVFLISLLRFNANRAR